MYLAANHPGIPHTERRWLMATTRLSRLNAHGKLPSGAGGGGVQVGDADGGIATVGVDGFGGAGVGVGVPEGSGVGIT